MNIKMKGNLDTAMELANLVMLLQFTPKNLMKEVHEKLKELVAIVNKGIIEVAIEHKLFSKSEYTKKFKDKYVENGIDTFPTLVGFILAGNEMFVTQNKKMVKDSEKIWDRFGIEVLSQQDFIQNVVKERENEFKGPPSYVG